MPRRTARSFPVSFFFSLPASHPCSSFLLLLPAVLCVVLLLLLQEFETKFLSIQAEGTRLYECYEQKCRSLKEVGGRAGELTQLTTQLVSRLVAVSHTVHTDCCLPFLLHLQHNRR